MKGRRLNRTPNNLKIDLNHLYFFKSLLDELPVDGVPILVEVLAFAILVVDVPSVLPSINTKNWESTIFDWIACIGVLVNGNRSIFIDGKIAPATSKDCGSFLRELCLESINSPEVLFKEVG